VSQIYEFECYDFQNSTIARPMLIRMLPVTLLRTFSRCSPVNLCRNFPDNSAKLQSKEVAIIKNVTLSKINCEVASALILMNCGKKAA
jgi:hypothetical protein